MRAPLSRVIQILARFILALRVMCSLIHTASIQELNLITCMRDPAEYYMLNSPSIEDICRQICNGSLTEVHFPRISANPPYHGNFRLLQGVQTVNSPIIYIFVSGWAGWPSNAPYRCNGNALYYAYLYQQVCAL
jgi:hypothetical protein